MPKEKSSLLGMIRGDEPGLIARLIHTVSGEDEGVWGENCIEKLLKNRISGVSFFCRPVIAAVLLANAVIMFRRQRKLGRR